MDLGLAGKAFIVTGGTRGLGLATARALVDEGACVLVVGREPTTAQAAAEQLGGSATWLAGDLSDASLPDSATQACIAAFGCVDGALVSVGGPPPGSVLTTSDAAWESAFASVFLGSVRMMRTAVEAVSTTAGHGSIAVVLSTSAQELAGGLSASNGLRPGLAMLVKDLADEVGHLGIRVNGLLPGRIATDRLLGLEQATGDPEQARAASVAEIPLGRHGDPGEFGRVAAFVLSPAASYVTGTLIRVDGGLTRSP